MVGKHYETFLFHSCLLFNSSSFFGAALWGEFREGGQQKIWLPEADPEMFVSFGNWLYSGDPAAPKSSGMPRERLGWEELIDLYYWSKEYMVPRLQNFCMYTLIDTHEENYSFPMWLIPKIYEQSSGPFCCLRIFTADVMAMMSRKRGTTWFGTLDVASYPKEFFVELSMALLEGARIHCLDKKSFGYRQPYMVVYCQPHIGSAHLVGHNGFVGRCILPR